jgi:ABC-type glycerol-3-phosphate transport system substrate-binding protein
LLADSGDCQFSRKDYIIPEINHKGHAVKKFVFLVMTLLAVNILPAQNVSGKLTVWSFTDELANMINNPLWGFKAKHPGVQVQYSQTPSDQFENKLDPVLASGRGAPDIIALESSFVRKYVESGYLLDLTDIYEANKNKLLAFPVEVGTYNGRVYALSWQACPGAMFYRRSLARKYLGTDDPVQVQESVSSLSKLLRTAKILKQKSNGKCVITPAYEDLFIPFLSARAHPWVVQKQIVIDPVAEEYMNTSKTLHENRLIARVRQWSEGWFAGMKDELKDEKNSRLEVFSYFMPTWGLHYVLKTNAPSTAGDWAMIQGPAPYYWGGTWIGAWKNTKNPDAAKEFIRYLTTDNGFLEAWAKDTGDFVSSTEVVNKIKDNYSEPYLGGQNHYAAFAENARNINGTLVQKTDSAIEYLFREAVSAYIEGEKTKAQALADFKTQAANSLKP